MKKLLNRLQHYFNLVIEIIEQNFDIIRFFISIYLVIHFSLKDNIIFLIISGVALAGSTFFLYINRFNNDR